MANTLGVELNLRTPHPEYLVLDDDESRLANYRALSRAHVEEDLATEIREVTDRGLALGESRFVDEMARLTGLRLRAGRMGRPPREERSREVIESRF